MSNVQRKQEVWVGLFVVIAFFALLFVAMKVSNFSGYVVKQGYTVTASFSQIGGLKPKAPVTLSGVVIGRVESVQIDPKTYRARVTFMLDAAHVGLPIDSSASILTAGLLGEQYVGIQPGADETLLQEGGVIEYTQSALVLEELIGKFLTSLSSNKD
jgi:phospholipid/cholesterol/gamma-HCH transport system substrate-binding protein